MWYRYFPRSRPRKASGGIKAQSKRGDFGKSWWAKRWIEVLESFELGPRLSRGRSYARGGQVLNIEIDKGSVEAQVQGSRPRPYDIEIVIKPLTAEDWRKVGAELSKKAIFTAKLLAGEMPTEVEKIFQKVNVPLFPRSYKDLKTNCSCPDRSNPCKHIAAVYYLIAEEFDRDPFLLFKLRGLDREDLVKLLGGRKSSSKSPPAKKVIQQAEPLPTDAAKFWNGDTLPENFFGEVTLAQSHAALPRRLGNFPFWRGDHPFLEMVEEIYKEAAPEGLRIFERVEGKEEEKPGD